MAQTVNLVTVMTALNNLMGRRVVPQGTIEDLERYCQYAFDYSWRYYKWGFSLKQATLVADGGGTVWMPEDFDIEGWRKFDSGTEVDITEIGTSTSSTEFAIIYDSTEGRYKTQPALPGSMTYQTAPPTLEDEVNVPFPSAMTVAVGATVYAKQAENPTRADISQEWDEFHAELDRHVARSDTNRPRRRPRNFHDVAGTYTGDVGA